MQVEINIGKEVTHVTLDVIPRKGEYMRINKVKYTIKEITHHVQDGLVSINCERAFYQN